MYLKICCHQLLIWWSQVEFNDSTLAEPINRYLWPSNHNWCLQFFKYLTVISILIQFLINEYSKITFSILTFSNCYINGVIDACKYLMPSNQKRHYVHNCIRIFVLDRVHCIHVINSRLAWLRFCPTMLFEDIHVKNFE